MGMDDGYGMIEQNDETEKAACFNDPFFTPQCPVKNPKYQIIFIQKVIIKCLPPCAHTFHNIGDRYLAQWFFIA